MTGSTLARLCGASASMRLALLSRRIAEATPAIRTLEQRRFQQVGALTNEGFVAWQPPMDNAVQCIRLERLALDREPTTGNICWLSNTEEGDRVARSRQ
jgi:hypothetical protein